MKKNTDERPVDRFLNAELAVGKINFRKVDILFIAVLWIFAFLMRYSLFPIKSADYTGFLEEWIESIRMFGAWKSLGMEISNYTSPYMYIMSVASLTENPLYALKYASVVFDYFASVVMFMLVYELTGSRNKSVFGMAFFLLSPTVILNGAYWCQCDIIYSSLVLLSLLFFFRGKSMKCFIALGIAFSFKLQTLFILPFYVIMWLKNRTVKIWHAVFIPVMYIIMHIPAWIAGRSIKEWLFIYVMQSDYYPWGSLNYPNAYTFLDETIYAGHHMNEVSGAGMFLTLMLLGVVAYYFCCRKIKLNSELMITTAMFTLMVVLYVLPHMHERYGFMIDMLSIVYCILNPKKTAVTLTLTVLSVLIYMPYLIAVDVFRMQSLAVVNLICIAVVCYDLLRQIRLAEIPEEAAAK